LRPFEVQDSHLFFGREGQTEELLRRLSANRFLAVSGISGSGKSSLVRAGLLSALNGGWSGSGGSAWRQCIFRPGDDPIGNLARSLARLEAFGEAGFHSGTTEDEILIEAVLRRGPTGLVSSAREARLAENLLIVVDQFEEIFRCESAEPAARACEDAAAFIDLLLAATSGDGNLYVVITLRSEFLGKCSRFRGLPEAINQSQYLTPRMTREERKRVLLGPVAVGGGKISARLVQRILNEWGDDPDRLPLVQHALMRAWEHCERRDAATEIDFDDYKGLDEALSSHADAVYEALPVARQLLAKKMFQALTERTREGSDIRRPTRIDELCAICGADVGDVIGVVEEFRREGRSFLVPPPREQLTPASRIDVTHESLLIRWGKLQNWINEEVESRRIYIRLAESAVLHQKGEAGLWSGADLRPAMAWLKRESPNQAWGRRYHREYETAIQFLRRSETHAVAARRYKILAISLLAATAIGVLLWVQSSASSERFAKAQALVALARVDAGAPARNAVLALLADHYYSSMEADRMLRRSLALLPKSLIAAKYPGEITSLLFLKRAGLLAVAGSKGVALFDTGSGNKVAQVETEGGVRSVVASPGDDLLVILSGGRAYFWDVAKRQLRTKLPAASVNSVDVSPDGARVATGSADGSVLLWDAATGVQALAMKPSNLASSRSRLDADKGAGAPAAPPESPVESVRFSPDGQWIATGGAEFRIWSASTGEAVRTFPVKQSLEWLEWSPDGRHIAVRTSQRLLHVASVSEGTLRPGFGRDTRVNSAAFSRDSSLLLTANADDLAQLWDMETAVELWRVRHSDVVLGAFFINGDKEVVTSCSDGATRLFD
jgi:WD40 repeat protein